MKTLPPAKPVTPAELERLAIIAEEMGEAQQVIGKIIRHGFDNFNPFSLAPVTNRAALEKELGDVRAAMILLCDAGDIRKSAIHEWAEVKRKTALEWFRHQ